MAQRIDDTGNKKRGKKGKLGKSELVFDREGNFCPRENEETDDNRGVFLDNKLIRVRRDDLMYKTEGKVGKFDERKGKNRKINSRGYENQLKHQINDREAITSGRSQVRNDDFENSDTKNCDKLIKYNRKPNINCIRAAKLLHTDLSLKNKFIIDEESVRKKVQEEEEEGRRRRKEQEEEEEEEEELTRVGVVAVKYRHNEEKYRIGSFRSRKRFGSDLERDRRGRVKEGERGGEGEVGGGGEEVGERREGGGVREGVREGGGEEDGEGEEVKKGDVEVRYKEKNKFKISLRQGIDEEINGIKSEKPSQTQKFLQKHFSFRLNKEISTIFKDDLGIDLKKFKLKNPFSLYSINQPSIIIQLIILAILFDVTTILANRLQENNQLPSISSSYNSSANEVTDTRVTGNRLKNHEDYLLLLEPNANFTDDLEKSAKNNSYLDGNSSLFGTVTNGTEEEPLYDFIFMGVTSVVLGIMILITVIGNVFVIAAILLERNLQNVANYLIVSLAVADLMVACLVMPLGAVYEISRGWILGPELCDMWTSSDVLCCTASILHLVAIAVDRYWAVTNVDYIHTRNGSRIVTMIVVVWSVALVVSLAPQFGWKDPDYLDRINLQQRCLVSQDIGYQIFATCSTFYVPLLVILVLYWKIFQTARKRIRRRRAQRNAVLEANRSVKETGDEGQTKESRGKRTLHYITKRRFLRSSRNKSDNQQASLALVEGQSSTEVLAEEEAQISSEDQVTGAGGGGGGGGEGEVAVTTAFTISSPSTDTNHRVKEEDEEAGKEVNENQVTNNNTAVTSSSLSSAHLPPPSLGATHFPPPPLVSAHLQPPPSPSPSPLPSHTPHHPKRDLKKESLEVKRERKAAKTLAIITGAFVVCWLPFFIMALLMPLCESCTINNYVASFFLWLGYFNSTLNPVIYTIFSPEFRQAFKRMLCGQGNGGRGRGRKLR